MRQLQITSKQYNAWSSEVKSTWQIKVINKKLKQNRKKKEEFDVWEMKFDNENSFHTFDVSMVHT